MMEGPLDKVNTTASVAAGDDLVARDLTFAYLREPVLREVSFSLARRPIGLLGPNGSGKTTLLRAILGHLPLPPGKVVVMGADMGRRPRPARRRLGWMPERGGIVPGMSGVGLVGYMGELAGMPTRDAMQRAHEVLDYVGLAEERYRKCEDYSQGMRQRLKLAQALVHDPEWLLLDEPTSGLDPRGRVGMLKLVADLAGRKGFGILLSTHLLADVEAVCEEILVLRGGRLLAHAPIDRTAVTSRQVWELEGFGDEDVLRGRLEGQGAQVAPDGRRLLVTLPGGDSDEGAARILAAAAGAGYALRRMHRQTVRLEDLFFDLVRE